MCQQTRGIQKKKTCQCKKEPWCIKLDSPATFDSFVKMCHNSQIHKTFNAAWPLLVVAVWRWVSGGARTSAPWGWAGFPPALLCHHHLLLSPALQRHHLPAAQAPTLLLSLPHWRGACSTLDTVIWSHSAPGGRRRTWMSKPHSVAPAVDQSDCSEQNQTVWFTLTDLDFFFRPFAAEGTGGRVLAGRRKAPICVKWQVGKFNSDISDEEESIIRILQTTSVCPAVQLCVFLSQLWPLQVQFSIQITAVWLLWELFGIKKKWLAYQYRK